MKRFLRNLPYLQLGAINIPLCQFYILLNGLQMYIDLWFYSFANMRQLWITDRKILRKKLVSLVFLKLQTLDSMVSGIRKIITHFYSTSSWLLTASSDVVIGLHLHCNLYLAITSTRPEPSMTSCQARTYLHTVEVYSVWDSGGHPHNTVWLFHPHLAAVVVSQSTAWTLHLALLTATNNKQITLHSPVMYAYLQRCFSI